MDKLLGTLHQLTLEAIAQLDYIGYEQMEDFVARREQIISQLQSLKQNYNDQQKVLIREILQYDDLIVSRMNKLKGDAAEGIEKLERARIQNRAYDPSYTQESYFFDKKK